MKRLYKGLNWVGQGFLGLWRVSRFYFFPSERNLFFSTWYDFVHFKRLRPDGSVLDFLDDRVRFMKREVANPDSSPLMKQLYGDLVKALHHPGFRVLFIAFLESSSLEEQYERVRDALRSAWRMEVVDEAVPPEALVVEGSEQRGVRLLKAKTYFIAAELHFELAGREEEFQVKSRQMSELMAFVKEQFCVERLPGTFDKLKGYTYKSVLTGRNDAKKGQLKPHFRQIIENPQVFGEAIAARARLILTKGIP
jgi:hypothetical protein